MESLLNPPRGGDLTMRWLRVAVGIGCSLMVAGLLLVLLVRRLSGALDEPATAVVLLACLLVGLICSAAYRLPMLPDGRLAATRRDGLLWAFPSGCLLLLALALTHRDSPSWAVGLFWGGSAASEALWWSVLWYGRLPHRTARAPSPPQVPSGTAEQALPAEIEPPQQPDELAEEVLQQWTRALDTGGEEVIHAVLRADLVAGERTYHFHLPFCPPLPRPPAVEAFQIEGPPGSIKVAQRETFGVRLEVRLHAAASRVERIGIEVLAQAE